MVVDEEKERKYIKGIAEEHGVSFESLWERFNKSKWKIDDFIATVVEEFNEK